MPTPADDHYFGGKPGSAREAYDAMVEQYGAKKAEQVFYAKRNRNKRRRRGTLARIASKK